MGEQADQFAGGPTAQIAFVVAWTLARRLEAVDAPAGLVPVVHRPDVAQAAVVPVGEIDRPVGSESGVDGTEPAIRRLDRIFLVDGAVGRAVAFEAARPDEIVEGVRRD